MLKSATFSLIPRGPFSFTHALRSFEAFPPLRHQVGPDPDGRGVRFGCILDGDLVPVAIHVREADDGRLVGTVTGTARVEVAARQVARIFSLDHDATEYAAIAQRAPSLGALMKSFEGLRPVCFTSPYESAAWAILSQRISAAQAARLVGAIVRDHGHQVDALVAVFPSPEKMLTIDSIRSVPQVKLERLRGVALAALEGKLDADQLRKLGDVDGPASLRSLAGIGPFWSSGIYLRACGIADVFPDEPRSIAALGQLHGLGDRPDATTLQRLTEAFRPFRMWICFLLRVAAARGGRLESASLAT